MTTGNLFGPDALETGHFGDCACFNLRRAARAVTRAFDDALRPSGLRATQFTLLVSVGFSGTLTVSGLAEATATDRTTLTRNLRPLERGGLVTIRPGRDRREREIVLTPEGRERVDRAVPMWRTAQQRLTRELGGTRFSRLLEDLEAAAHGAGRFRGGGIGVVE